MGVIEQSPLNGVDYSPFYAVAGSASAGSVALSLLIAMTQWLFILHQLRCATLHGSADMHGTHVQPGALACSRESDENPTG